MIYRLIFFATLLFALSSCKKDIDDPIANGGDEDDDTEVVTPGKEVLVWVDARSNIFGTYGRFHDKEEARAVLDTLKDCGVTGLVIDVKGSSGWTLYPSAYTDEYKSLDGKTRLDDYVPFMIAEARERGFKVYLSIVTFVDGDRSGFGYAYQHPAYRSKYESIVVTNAAGDLGPISSTGRNVFVNPGAPEVRERALNIVREIVQTFQPDGLLLDYGRYANISADFSDLSKEQFISFLETEYNDTQARQMRFPQDIVSTWRESDGQMLPATTGKYYGQWLIYRSSVIQSFMKEARNVVKSTNPAVDFGVYVGAWYGTYYQVGVNWASNEYDPFQDFQLRFDWAYPGYGETGYAEELDVLLTGNYFTQVMLSENPATAHLKYHWWSIEGSLNGIEYITKNKVPLYGSLDIGNVSYSSKSEISRAIQYILSRASGGIMLFDVVHMYGAPYNRLKQPLFDAVKAGIKGE